MIKVGYKVYIHSPHNKLHGQTKVIDRITKNGDYGIGDACFNENELLPLAPVPVEGETKRIDGKLMFVSRNVVVGDKCSIQNDDGSISKDYILKSIIGNRGEFEKKDWGALGANINSAFKVIGEAFEGETITGAEESAKEMEQFKDWWNEYRNHNTPELVYAHFQRYFKPKWQAQKSPKDVPVEDVHAKSLAALDKLIKEMPKEEFQALMDKCQLNDPNGVTLGEYFARMSGQTQKPVPVPVQSEVEEAYKQRFKNVLLQCKHTTASDEWLAFFKDGVKWQAQKENVKDVEDL